MIGDGIDRRREAMRKRIAELDAKLFSDAAQFTDALNEIAKLKIEGEALLIVKKVILDVYSRIVERTPVDTGRAAASWQVGIESEPRGEVPEGNWKSEIPAIVAENVEKLSVAEAGIWFIANHLDYIERLEAGWSKRQPEGMVGVTLRELSRQLTENMPL